MVERERQINVLTLLRELSLDALSVIQPDDIFQAVLRTALILLEGDETTLYSYDEVHHTLNIIGSIQTINGQIDKSLPAIPNEILYDTVEKGSLKLISDVTELAQFNENEASWKDFKHRSLIIMPVARRNQVHEILYVAFHERRKFTHDELNIVDLLTVQVAGHLENAALNEEITTSNNRMRAILDSTRDGIILLTNSGEIQEVNMAAGELTGIELQAYLFKPLSHIPLNTLTEQSASTWQQIIATYRASPGSIHNQEFAFQHDDETVVHVKMLVTGVIDETQAITGRLLVLRDITEEKKLQDFRETMQSMVLHDLRGPLTAIVTSMYVAENMLALHDDSANFDELKESLQTTFGVSLSSAEDMLRQVDTLRDLPMMNQMQVKPQEIPVYDIAGGAYNSLSANFMDSNIKVELDIDPEHSVFVDESLIRRVIVNLMHNAFKFTPVDGKVMVRLVATADKADYVTIQIADTGPGIPESQRERIFGQFVQIEGQKPRAGGKGTGLGLNFCKLAVEAHGGQIRVDADGPLSGACFSFTIPGFDWRKSSQTDNS